MQGLYALNDPLEPSFESLPREALAGEPPAVEAIIIKWKDQETWDYLKYCRDYVEANPDDIANKLVYRNLLRWYRNS